MLGEAPKSESSGAPMLLSRLLAAAAEGDRRMLRAAFDGLMARPLAAHFIQDLTAVSHAIDPARALPEDGPLRRWLVGQTSSPPPALMAIANRRSVHAGRGVLIFREAASARRLLAAAAGLLTAEDAEAVVPEGERAATMIAALALADGGLSIPQLFEAVFGATFDAVKHDGLFRTTLYRARASLGERAVIERTAGKLRLLCTQPFFVLDPRADGSLDDEVLFALATRSGRAGAKDLASDLSVPLRTVQDALRRLVELGACVRAKRGRAVEYMLEDTTCYEPTVHRLKAN